MKREVWQMSKRLAVVLGIILLIVPSLLAQEKATSSIQGTVKDAQGAAVTGATVELASDALFGGKTTTTTDSAGFYRFDNLRPATYNLSVTKAGFATYKQEEIMLAVGRSPSIDVSLKVGTVEEVVEVTGVAPQIDVTQSKVQTNITQDMLEDVPKGRSYQSLIQFAPGARAEPLEGGAGGQAPNSRGVAQTMGYSIDGAANSENSYMVEGQETADIRYGTATTNVPMEFTQEVVIKSSGFEAENGGAMGGVVNLIQKRGSNTWHGSVFTYYSADTFDAAPNRIYSNTYQPKKDHYRLWEPGFDVGGFLWKDKIWLFASFVPRMHREERTVFMTQINNPRKFSSDTDTYYSLARVDANPFTKLHLYASWQYNYEKNQGYSQPGPDDVFGLTNPGGAASNPDNYNHGIGYKQPNVIFGAGGDYAPTPALLFSSRWGRQFYNYMDIGLPVGIRYIYRNTAYLPNTPNGSYDPTIAPGNASTTALDGTTLGTACPSCVHASGFSNIGANSAYIFDKYWRTTWGSDASYFVKGWGSHNFKFGYLLTKLSNDVINGYNTAQAYIGYNRLWSPTVSSGLGCNAIVAFNATQPTWAGDPRSADCRGLWGTVNFREYGEFGLASSTLHGLYAQDSWQIGHGVALNLGMRFEKEFVPTFTPGFPSINFNFNQKVAPRLGVAWDVFGNNKLKVYGSFGYFYNPVKYDLPRGSFGGNYWHDCVYALDVPDYNGFVPVRGASGHFCDPTGGASSASTVPNPFGRPNGGLIANEDFRIPSNDPGSDCTALQNTPGSCVAALLALQPMKQHQWVVGADWQIRPSLALMTRYARNRLDRAIEDTGVIGPDGEIYSINNPGFGFNATMYGTGLPPIPKAIRNYDGLEIRLVRAASSAWYGELAYTYSRLYGNYAGGTNTDVADGGGGRQSNTGRAFDEPMGSFDAHGNPINGPMATDRPHTFKAAGYYRVKWWKMNTVFGIFQQLYSGSALSSYADVYGMNTELEGRGNWITVSTNANRQNYVLDSVRARRTPSFSQSDFSIVQEMNVGEGKQLGFEVNFTNIFNQHSPMYYYQSLGEITPTSINTATGCSVTPLPQACIIDYHYLLTGGYNYINELNGVGMTPGTPNTLSANYGKPYGWQQPRGLRFKIKFSF